MLNSVRIRNFRRLRDLTIGDLARVNLFGGRNNTGKTTLLESLWMLARGGRPQAIMRAARGIESAVGTPETVRDVLWRSLFTDLDTNERIEISAIHESRGALTLTVMPSKSGTVEIPLGGSGLPRNGSALDKHDLLFVFTGGNRRSEARLRTTGNGMAADESEIEEAFGSAMLLSNTGDLQEDARMLGRLSRRKQQGIVADALRIVEPELMNVYDNSSSGRPMIWGDIGLPELVPLPVMGEGMTRLARLVLAICATPGGLVLADDIESGIHYSVMPDVWRAVDLAAQKFGAQVIATTHSAECIEAAHKALDDDSFRYHRLNVKRGENRCTTYAAESMRGAVFHGFEVRGR